jgi:hypothetical protein
MYEKRQGDQSECVQLKGDRSASNDICTEGPEAGFLFLGSRGESRAASRDAPQTQGAMVYFQSVFWLLAGGGVTGSGGSRCVRHAMVLTASG